MKLARELEFEEVDGIDASSTAVAAASAFGSAGVAEMTKLPHGDSTFDAVISTGVVYYGALADLERAAWEIRRVLKPDGWGFITTKSTRDWRRGSGDQIAEETFVLRIPGEPEDGMTLTFLSAAEVGRVFGVFRDLRVELAEHTTMNRLRVNSDWLVTVWK